MTKSLRDKQLNRSKGPSSASIRFVGPRLNKKRRQNKTKGRFLYDQSCKMKKSPTASESIFADKLRYIGVAHESQWVVICGGIAAIYDFCIFEPSILIEIDGGYHNQKSQKQTDDIKDWIATEKLHKAIIRLTNEEARDIDPIELIHLIYGVKGRQHQVRAS